MRRDNPFDYLLTPFDLRLPMEYATALRAPLAPYLREDPPATIRALAESVAAESGWQTLRFLGRSTSACSPTRRT